ncbi:M15 family metallopeptidase [Thalassotalea euphylliae]|nr:M15 family metallopeptidase [Thalassotalea euphylliae]
MTKSITVTTVTGIEAQHIQWLDERHGINHQVYHAWQSMVEAAAHEQLTLTLASSFRSFERQLSIWNRKFHGELPVLDINEQAVNMSSRSDLEKIKAIMLFSALPGASRHHWGTDLDVYASNLLGDNQALKLEQWEYQAGGPMHRLSTWLAKHASDFGFFFPYDKYRGGVAVEPWHISHFDSASDFQASLTLNCLADCIAQAEIAGKSAILSNLDELYDTYIMNIGAYPHG